MTDLDHDIALLQRWAEHTLIVERVWLFGSRVRGTHAADSDLDVAVQHAVAPGDGDLFTTGLLEHLAWCEELQPQAKLKLDIQSYILGDTLVVEAGLKESSQLIFDRNSLKR